MLCLKDPDFFANLSAHPDKNKINNESSNKSGIQGSRIVLPENYMPTDIEEYMNENHLEFFRQKLLIYS